MKALNFPSLRVAVVHEWLVSYAGSERVAEQMLELCPNAECYTLVDYLPDQLRGMLHGRPIHTSFIQKMPWARTKFRKYLLLMPLAIEHFDLSAYELILSSNHAVAKGVITRADQLHISYVHSPMRYAWDLEQQYLRDAGLTGIKGWAAQTGLHYLRHWDQLSAQRVDRFMANSYCVARRIWKHYRRKAHVVYPPVNVDHFALRVKKDDYYFTASRFVPYKRIDLIVEAFSRTPRRKLVVIGDGPEFKKIAAKAGPNVELLGYQPDDVLRDYMQNSRAFVFAAEEDFGIAPVEAQGCGTPVIAFGRGGATETVVPGKTGLFFDEQTPAGLLAAIDQFEATEKAFDPYAIRAQAEKFSVDRFRRRFSFLVERTLRHFQRRCRSRPGH